MNEEIVIPIIVFSFVLSLVWMILNYFKWRQKARQEEARASDSSLRTSELKNLMREAVEEGVGPLAHRIELLEAQFRGITSPRLMPAQPEEMIEEFQEIRDEVAEPAKRSGVT